MRQLCHVVIDIIHVWFKCRRKNRSRNKKIYSYEKRIRKYKDIGDFSFYKKINHSDYHGFICTKRQFYNGYIRYKLGLDNISYHSGKTYLEYTYSLHK